LEAKSGFEGRRLFGDVPLTCNHLVAYTEPVDRTAKEALPDTAADRIFKAIADPGRRRLLDRLRVKGGLTLNELCEGMPMSRQAVKKHLAQLEGADLVVTRWVGRELEHYLNPVPIHAIARRWIKPFEHVRLDALSNLKKHLED
jgi:DNA-binding transcriptional ArsR family regulator